MLNIALRSPVRLIARTAPLLASAKGYDPARHAREAAFFTRWALELGIGNSSRPWPARLVMRARVLLAWGLTCARGGHRLRGYAARRREALSTVWNTWLYTDDGVTLAPVSVNTRSARLFVARIIGREDHALTAAVLPVLREEFAALVIPLHPRLQPRPHWVTAF